MEVTKKTQKVVAVGEISGYVMIQRCYMCHNVFVMSNADYINMKYGCHIINRAFPGSDSWCCKECADEIKKIRDMG